MARCSFHAFSKTETGWETIGSIDGLTLSSSSTIDGLGGPMVSILLKK